jgi:riboflavin biosynthesis pyrimidine reductase
VTDLRQIYPPAAGAGAPDLPALYAYPGGSQAAGRPWVRANMIASADGAAAVDGLSGGLSGTPDRTVFGLLRALADVILVGAGTVRDEQYAPARIGPRWAGLRAGRPAAPAIAVLTGRLDLDLDGPLLTQAPADARTIVLTTESSPAALRAQAAQNADVIIAGGRRGDPAAAIAALAGRGYRNILAEGGPHLLGQLAEAALLDELCVTVSPVLAAGAASRIIAGPPGGVARLELAHVLTQDDFLLCRYLRRPA